MVLILCTLCRFVLKFLIDVLSGILELGCVMKNLKRNEFGLKMKFGIENGTWNLEFVLEMTR